MSITLENRFMASYDHSWHRRHAAGICCEDIHGATPKRRRSIIHTARSQAKNYKAALLELHLMPDTGNEKKVKLKVFVEKYDYMQATMRGSSGYMFGEKVSKKKRMFGPTK